LSSSSNGTTQRIGNGASSQLTADELELIRSEIDAMTLEEAVGEALETQASNAGAKSVST
jgi:hypothetical protein